jgi:hypothetical protein
MYYIGRTVDQPWMLEDGYLYGLSAGTSEFFERWVSIFGPKIRAREKKEEEEEEEEEEEDGEAAGGYPYQSHAEQFHEHVAAAAAAVSAPRL